MSLDLSPLWISLKTASLATGITFFLGITAAYWMLGYRGRWKSLIEGIFISPLILPPTVVGFLLLLLFGRNGPIGKLMLPFDFTIVFTWYAAVITATVVAFPLMYKTALGAFEQIDGNLLQVARTLGASEWKIFWRITLPLAIPGILAGATLSFARALGEFGATLMLAGNIPGQTQTIPMAIYFAVEAGAMNEAWFWAIAILSISLSGIVAVNIWQEWRNKGARGRGSRRTLATVESHPPVSPLNAQIPLQNGLTINIQKQLGGFELEAAFEVQGRTLGLLGASGAGKSMILRCIAGVEVPTFGKIVLNNRVLFDSERQINLPSSQRHVGLVFQNYALFPHLTVAQNIAFGLQTLPKQSQHITQQLTALSLQGLGDRYPHQLSGGQQQRVALARALVTEPEALLLDEPFSALDTHLRSQIEQQLIETLSTYQGVTLFVTHNLEEAYRVCQDLLVLEQGRAIAHDAKHAVFEDPQTVSVAQLTGCKNFSHVVVRGSQQIEAIAWDCTLQVVEPIPEGLAQVGIRAHQLRFVEEPGSLGSQSEIQNSKFRTPSLLNTFPCWLAATSETPHRITLYLKLHTPPTSPRDHHLQAEVFKEKWEVLKDQSFPWYVCLDPLRLMLLKDF